MAKETKEKDIKNCNNCEHRKPAGNMKYSFKQYAFKCEKTGQPRSNTKYSCKMWKQKEE